MYVSDGKSSFYDIPIRSTISEIEEQKLIVNEYTIVKKLLDALPNAAVLLNSNRQIVAYNKIAKSIFTPDKNNGIEGRRVGEAINESECVDVINDFKPMMYTASEQLLKEIQTQRDLIDAEHGSLTVNKETKSVNEIMSKAFNIYKDSMISDGKNYSCVFEKNEMNITTDSVLLVRSLSNLIKNALEATDINGNVKVFAERDDAYIKFSVFNDKVIPDNVQLQIFQRSFSTKARSGRGIGTYSVKLLVEHYLNGKVSFKSNNDIGTIFTLTIPIEVKNSIPH